jgi:SSS family solute:Na+ symporter
LLAKYFPTGMLGLGLTALMASFMSGMAGNVTAFNTVWTYDLYHNHINPKATDSDLVRMGRITTVIGLLISAGCAYTARESNNIMDMLQLVFGFVNAPLFAAFLLGMFWRRSTGHGAFYGLITGTVCAMIFHGLTLPSATTAPSLIKGGWITAQHTFTSSMAQNFWMAIFAFVGCFVATVVISLATKANKTDDELRGLVYSLTPKTKDESAAWYARPATLGALVLAGTVVLNVIFW